MLGNLPNNNATAVIILSGALVACDSATDTTSTGISDAVDFENLLPTRGDQHQYANRMAATVSGGEGTELLVNGNFASGTHGWSACKDTPALSYDGVNVTIPAGNCIQQGDPVSAGDELTFTCEVAKTSITNRWTQVGLTFYDSSWNVVGEPSPAIVNSASFREYSVSGTAPAGAVFAGVWIYSATGAQSPGGSGCSLKLAGLPDNPPPPVTPGENLLINSEFNSTADGQVTNWIDYCGNYTVINEGGDAGVNLVQSCLVQSLNNSQAAALSGRYARLTCDVEKTNPYRYAAIRSNIFTGSEISIVNTLARTEISVAGAVSSNLVNGFVSAGGTMKVYGCQLEVLEAPGQNQPPVANDDNLVYDNFFNGGGEVRFRVLANDIEPDGQFDYRSFNITQQPEIGFDLYSFGDGELVHSADIKIPITFKYTISDDMGAVSNEATVTVDFDYNDEPNNVPPVAVDDVYQVESGGRGYFRILENDYDPDGSWISDPIVTSGPSHGVISSIWDGNIAYENNGDGSTSDLIEYEIIDSAGARSSAQVIINVR